MKRACLLAALLALTVLSCSRPDLRLVPHSDLRFKDGDRSEFARESLDDSDWTRASIDDLPQPDGVLWLRAEFEIPEGHAESGPLGLYFAGLAAHEAYWDGRLIGSGGDPAAESSDERPGPLESLHLIPPELATPGVHLVAVRTSAHHRHFRPRRGYWTLLVGDYENLLSFRATRHLLSLMSLSGIVIVGLFALIMFLVVDRTERAWMWLSIVCLLAASLLVAEAWRGFVNYTYDQHLTRLIAVTSLTALLNLAILKFVIVRFPGGRSRWFLLAATAGIALSMLMPGFDGKALMMFATGMSLSLVWTIIAIPRHQSAAVLASVGFLSAVALLLLSPWIFADFSLFFALDLLLLFLLITHAMKVKRSAKEREDALMKSARLEIELLKRHIQPHFLMNTLTALSEWIEEEPAVASSMISSLAEEFRLLSEISNRPLIRMEEELRLCQSHIEIMSRREDRNYRLERDGVDPDILIPPAVIHTLVENAITHNRYDGDQITMRLIQRAENGSVRLQFDSPIGEDSPSVRREGTGLRYIRARLTESFGSDWNLESGATGTTWRTTILMPSRRAG